MHNEWGSMCMEIYLQKLLLKGKSNSNTKKRATHSNYMKSGDPSSVELKFIFFMPRLTFTILT